MNPDQEQKLSAITEIKRTISSKIDLLSSDQISFGLRNELRELEDIKLALDAACIVAIADQNGRISYVNDKFIEISGYSRQELIGKTHSVVNSSHHDKAFFEAMWKTISTGEIWQGEIKNRRKDGSYYWVETSIIPFLDEQGKPYQFVSIRTDITQRKNAEEQLKDTEDQLQLQALLTGRLSALAELSGSIAHELNQPLSGIRMYSKTIENLLEQDEPDQEKLKSLLEKIVGQVDRASVIIQHIRDFSSERNDRRQDDVNLHEVVESVRELVGQQLKSRGIQLQNNVPEDLFINAHFNRMEQVIINLVSNARDSFNGKKLDQKTIEISGSDNGQTVTLYVKDNGAGINDRIKERIFEPFITNKGPDKGTGLGLSICHGIVRDYNGAIQLEHSDENGTCFGLTFPSLKGHQ